MLISSLLTLLTISNYFYCGTNGLIVLSDDKRQDQIPVPRIGRADVSPFMIQPYPMQPFFSPMEVVVIDDIVMYRDGRNNWLIPHLGRRKRSIQSGPKFSGIQNARPFTSKYNYLAIEDLLRKTPWTILAYKGVDKKMAFNPRLGRAMTPRLGKKSLADSDELSPDKKIEQLTSSDDFVQVEQRAAFSPRLGRGGSGNFFRRASPFAPRLGRADQTYEVNQTNHVNM
ncbi:hypothetical protein CHUAL_012848 [Chamberlinius hualienensis]